MIRYWRAFFGIVIIVVACFGLHWVVTQEPSRGAEFAQAGLALLCLGFFGSLLLAGLAFVATQFIEDTSPMVPFPQEEDLVEDRKRFELWAVDTFGLCVERANVYDNLWMYRDKETQLAWESWKACVRYQRERVSRC